MSNAEIKSIITHVVNAHPEHVNDIVMMLNSFSYAQLEEYARVAKLYGGY